MLGNVSRIFIAKIILMAANGTSRGGWYKCNGEARKRDYGQIFRK